MAHFSIATPPTAGALAHRRLQELQAQGFRGSDKRAWLLTRGWPAPEGPRARRPLLRAADQLEADDAASREALRRACPDSAATALARALGHLVRARRVAAPAPRQAAAEARGSRELRRFALGPRGDGAAVRAAWACPGARGRPRGG